MHQRQKHCLCASSEPCDFGFFFFRGHLEDWDTHGYCFCFVIWKEERREKSQWPTPGYPASSGLKMGGVKGEKLSEMPIAGLLRPKLPPHFIHLHFRCVSSLYIAQSFEGVKYLNI